MKKYKETIRWLAMIQFAIFGSTVVIFSPWGGVIVGLVLLSIQIIATLLMHFKLGWTYEQ